MLETLIQEEKIESILESFTQQKELYVEEMFKTDDLIESLPYLSSVDDIFNWWQGSVDVYNSGIADEVNSSSLIKEKAKESYNKGTVLFNDANRLDQKLEQTLGQIIGLFRLSSLTYARSLIYASSEGLGTDSHFDQNVNLIFQVSGQKKWWVAKNDHVENPLTRFTMGTQRDDELKTYSQDFPTEFPNVANEYLLKPGDFLFLPRGAWHKTKALEGESIALNFTLTIPSWVDLLTSAFRSQLVKDKRWRDFASELDRPEKIMEFEELLAELKVDLMDLNAGTILNTTENQH